VLEKMPIIDTPFDRVAVDLVGPIFPPTERGNKYILTMMDYATKYPEAVPLKDIQAETVAEALVKCLKGWCTERNFEGSEKSILVSSREGIVFETVSYDAVSANLQRSHREVHWYFEEYVEAHVC